MWLLQLQFLARGQHVLPGVKDFIRSVSVEYLPTQMGPLSESIEAILQARGFSYKSFGSRQSKGHHVPGSPPTEHELQSDWARVPPEEIATPEQTGFLPMFPWYSGTSADMYRTVFDLIISLKLFLGRFDMRTMQVRIRGLTSHLLLPPNNTWRTKRQQGAELIFISALFTPQLLVADSHKTGTFGALQLN